MESHSYRERADHHGGRFRSPGPWRVLRSDRRHPRRGAESSVPGAGQPGHGAAGQNRQRIDPRREGEGAEGDAAAGGEEPRARAVSWLSERERCSAGLESRDLCRVAARSQFLALARRSVLHSCRQVAACDMHGAPGPVAPAADRLSYMHSRAELFPLPDQSRRDRAHSA